VLVLEQLEHALARGAHIYAEFAGFGVTEDAFHLTAPSPDGRWASMAMRRAVDDAGATLEQVDHISAHATGTPMNDEVETLAIKLAFGQHAYRIPISGIKSMIGHTAGGAGALATIACVKSIVEGIIPPTINYQTPDPQCDLDYVPNVARRAPVRLALANAFGFGGQNAVVAVKEFEEL
jgi:3-oxoacyl-[acyl-carrier-protein] synthase II